jgi:hypothetical protein
VLTRDFKHLNLDF